MQQCEGRVLGAALLTILACGVATAPLGAQSPDASQTDPPTAVVPTGTATSVSGLLYVRPFTLEQPYRYVYTAEQSEITSGFLLVLEVDRELAQPRDFAMPVLYVGTRPAELLNFGHLSGRIVALIPGDTDLATAAAYFGSTELPERVDATRGEQELTAALARGVRPFAREVVDAARAAGGSPIEARNIDAVYRAGGELILRYAPEERETAEGYLLIPER